MARRSRAREIALQLLYESDRNPAGSTDPDRDRAFVERRLRGAALREFALQLVSGVREKLPAIDEWIQQAAENWSLNRMTPIDRSILRLATYEVVFQETPAKVAIDEAVELAKRFGTAESPRFVNGLLDRILTDHARPAPSPADTPASAEMPAPTDPPGAAD